MRFVLLLFVFAACHSGYSQALEMVTNLLPLKNGRIYERDKPDIHCGTAMLIKIFSKSDSVFSLTGGRVFVFSGLKQKWGVVVETVEQDFVRYYNFKSVAVKRGDTITKGTFIGVLAGTQGRKEKELLFGTSNRRQQRSYQKELEFLKVNDQPF